MSKIAFTPNASGSGVLTVVSPNTNSDYTLTLPESTSTVLTDGSQNYASFFRLNSARSQASGGATEVITANWEVVDSRGQSNKNTAVSQSSGVFSFPATGFWIITFDAYITHGSNNGYAGGFILHTLNNSSYTNACNGYTHLYASGGNYGQVHLQSIFDVTDTSNCKVKFAQNCETTGCQFHGDTDMNATWATFVRVGDT